MRCAPTAGAALVLCAATAGLLSAQGRPAPPEPPRFASWDEVNVLAHGLLQLGHGLREHVERTQGQLDELQRRLGACGGRAACPEAEEAAESALSPQKVPEAPEAAPDALQSLQVSVQHPASPPHNFACSFASPGGQRRGERALGLLQGWRMARIDL